MKPVRLRVLLLSPSLRSGGNATDARRLSRGLRAEGVVVRALATGGPGFARRLRRTVGEFRPDVVHAFHARKGGAPYAEIAGPGDPPLVVTLTGTEIHLDLAGRADARAVRRTLRRSCLVLSHGRALAAAAEREVPSIRGRTVVVPRAVELPPPDPRFDLRRAAGLPRDAIVFLLPCGLRRVKNPLFALAPLERARRRFPSIAFVHAGHSLDPALHSAMAAAARERPWVRTVGEVPHRRMGSLYAGADVVLNTSLSEGLSNAVLEAMAAGRAVLASDIPANREIVRQGKTGLLYAPGSEASFLRAAARLAGAAALRRHLGRAGRAAVAGFVDGREEARAVLAAYVRACSVPSPARAAASRPRRRG